MEEDTELINVLDLTGSLYRTQSEMIMSSTASSERRFLMVRLHDHYGQPVPNDKAGATALQLPEIFADATLIEGPDRNVAWQSVDLVFSHPSFVPVPHGERMPVVEVTGDHS